MVKREERGDGRPAHGVDEDGVEETVGGVGVRGDGQSAAEQGRVRHGDECRRAGAGLVVDGDRGAVRGEPGRLLQRRAQVLPPAAGPGHPVGGEVDLGGEPHDERGRAPPHVLAAGHEPEAWSRDVPPGRTPQPAHADRVEAARRRRRLVVVQGGVDEPERVDVPTRREAEGAGDVVARSHGDEAQRDVGAGDGIQPQVRHAVTADDDEGVDRPVARRGVGSGERAQGVRRGQVDRGGEVGQDGPDLLGDPGTVAGSRRGVDDQSDARSHAAASGGRVVWSSGVVARAARRARTRSRIAHTPIAPK